MSSSEENTNPMISQLFVEFGKVSNKLDDMSVKQGETNTSMAIVMERIADLPDHETRLRSLEKWKYGLPLTGLIALGSTALGVYSLLKGH